MKSFCENMKKMQLPFLPMIPKFIVWLWNKANSNYYSCWLALYMYISDHPGHHINRQPCCHRHTKYFNYNIYCENPRPRHSPYTYPHLRINQTKLHKKIRPLSYIPAKKSCFFLHFANCNLTSRPTDKIFTE